MTAVFTAPNSPPELSGSKSSKSSSYRSSSRMSSPDGAFTDVGNFEEIGLEDESVSYMQPSVPYGRAPGVARASTARMLAKSPSTNTRDLISNSPRSPYPSQTRPGPKLMTSSRDLQTPRPSSKTRRNRSPRERRAVGAGSADGESHLRGVALLTLRSPYRSKIETWAAGHLRWCRWYAGQRY